MPTIRVRGGKKKNNMNIQFVCAESLLRHVCVQRLLLDRNVELRKVPQRHGRADKGEEHCNAGHR